MILNPYAFGDSFSYRKVRFSLLEIVLYDFSVSRSCDFRKYLRKSRKIYDNLRGHRKFRNSNDVFGPLLHSNVGYSHAPTQALDHMTIRVGP